jgi:hypothetical protein
MRERLGVEAGGEALDERQQQHRVAQIGLDRLGDPGVLDLHGDRPAVAGRGAVHLADRGGGERLRLEVGEHVGDRPAELLAQEPLELGERHRRHVVAQRGEPALEVVALVLGQAVEVDHRQHLADLHRGAAHLAELLDELVDERGGPLVARRLRALRRADAIGRPHARPAQPLAGDEAAHARGPRDPARRELARLGGGIVGLGGHRLPG